MKVRDLIAMLEHLQPQDELMDMRVILSTDSEGNSFRPVPDEQWFSIGYYHPDRSWEGTVITDLDEIKQLKELGVELDPNKLERCFVLWPIN